jgi:antitoxin CptB
MTDDLDIRRRRAAWRASHRGTKELDLLIGRYAEAQLPGMSESELHQFEVLLSIQDPELQVWLLEHGAPADAGLSAIVTAMKRFHGLA